MKNRKLNRLGGRDYSEPGFYFVTVCVKEMKELFGKIKVGNAYMRSVRGSVRGADGIEKVGMGEMRLSGLGRLVKGCWEKIPDHFAGVRLDEFVVMPNHVHGIIWIRADGAKKAGNAYMRSVRGRARSNMMIPKIVQGFKATVSRKSGIQIWQKSYYDQIVRNGRMLGMVRKYIKENPKNWEKDKYNEKY